MCSPPPPPRPPRPSEPPNLRQWGGALALDKKMITASSVPSCLLCG